MAEKDKQFDPANPENKAITDGMEEVGDILRDMKDGKTPSEIAFGVDLGTEGPTPEQADLQLMDEMQETIDKETERTAVNVDDSPIEIGVPDIPEAPEGPLAELRQAHDGMMQELDEVVQKAQPRPILAPPARQAQVEQRARQRQAERKQRLGQTPQQRQAAQLQAEHGELFVEMGEVVEAAEPVAPDAALPPDVKARVEHPGKEGADDLGKAFADFAGADKQFRADLVSLLMEMAGDIRRLHFDLDAVRGYLERSRL